MMQKFDFGFYQTLRQRDRTGYLKTHFPKGIKISLEVGKIYERIYDTHIMIIDCVKMRDLEMEITSYDYDHLPWDDTPIYVGYCMINQKIFPFFEDGTLVSYAYRRDGMWNDHILCVSNREFSNNWRNFSARETPNAERN